MKKLIFLSLFALSISFYARSQTWTPIAGRYSYTFLKIDSLLYLPNGPTSTRPTPIAHAYWLRYNTDSANFEYSNGTKWFMFSVRPPEDFTDSYVGDGTKARDTTIAVTGGCGPVTIPYLYYKLPQYIGFRMRVNTFFQPLVHGQSGYCLFGSGYYEWDSQTGELFLLGFSDPPSNGIQFTMQPY